MSAMRATHLLDVLDAATAELGHWLATGEYATCARCSQRVPAAAAGGEPVRHQLGCLGRPGVWCEAATLTAPDPLLCECRHDPERHADRTGRCLAKDSYNQPCACPSYEEMDDGEDEEEWR